MQRSAALHWKHGTPFTLRWPPVDTSNYRAPSNPETPEFEAVAFDLAQLPAERGTYAPYYPPKLTIIDDPLRGSYLTRMHPYWTVGSKSGALWLSSWISPRVAPKWESTAGDPGVSWFPGIDWSHSTVTRNSTLWVPYWALLASYSAAWAAAMIWSRRRAKGRSTTLGVA